MSEAIASNEFSMLNHGLASSTCLQCHALPKKTQKELQVLYVSGQIKELLRVFFPVPYAMPPE